MTKLPPNSGTAALDLRWSEQCDTAADNPQIPSLPQQTHTATILENNNNFPPPGWGSQPPSAFPITAPLDAIGTAIVEGDIPEIPQKQPTPRSRQQYDPTRASYKEAKGRCTRPTHGSYADYGARGIEFRYENFKQFLADLGERPPGLTLDRVNNDGHYEPGNCRWATPEQQQNNRRNNRMLTAFGHTQTLAQWARERKIKEKVIRNRLNRGLSIKDALDSQKLLKGKALTAFGQTQPLAKWATNTGMSRQLIYERLKDGWEPEDALTSPVTPYKTRKDKGTKRRPYGPRKPKQSVAS